MPTKKKITKKPVRTSAKKVAPTKKSVAVKKTVSRSAAPARTSTKTTSNPGYWHSVKSGHKDTFDTHPNLKLLLFIFIVLFIIFMIVEIPIIYADSMASAALY